MRKIIYCEQNTDEWYKHRAGLVTASAFTNALAGGSGLTRFTYMDQLILERSTGIVQQNGIDNEYTRWGKLQEPSALAAYELETGYEVERVGLVLFDDNISCSPDGLVSYDGLLESKSLKTSNHMKVVHSGKVPAGNIIQIQGSLWITEREWCDCIFYDPRVEAPNDLKIIRMYRDDKKILKIRTGVNIFVNEMLEKLVELYS